MIPGMDTAQATTLLEFIRAAEKLKDTLRSGRTSTGRCESTAEHSWRLALLAASLQDDMGELDFTRVLLLCLVHDLGEALGGDVPAPESHDALEKSARERRDLATLLGAVDERLRGRFMGLWEEYELGQTPEAMFVKGLDKLETIIQHNQGRNVPGFDYGFNLGYGQKHTSRHPMLAQLRGLVDLDTQRRIDEAAARSPVAPHAGVSPSTLPEAHRQFLHQALAALQQDARIAGVWVAGSYVSDTMDAYSDVDLRIAVHPAAMAELRAGRREFAARLGSLLEAFSGEHVGQPDLLICLYDKPLLHVDLLFVEHVPGMQFEQCIRLWPAQEQDAQAPVQSAPPVDLDWMEQRFWIWVHYGAGKLARGELMEAVDFLAFLRMSVLGPLALEQQGALSYGVRRVETVLPTEIMSMLESTVARYERSDCARALGQCVALYRVLRERRAGPGYGKLDAELAAVAYLNEVSRGLLP
jgi:5'-deoxynucleotidase YfbR-like HD superfamily hydrolase/predicted nucleotidyltransferase